MGRKARTNENENQGRASERAFVRACVRACVRASVRACVRAHASVRACAGSLHRPFVSAEVRPRGTRFVATIFGCTWLVWSTR